MKRQLCFVRRLVLLIAVFFLLNFYGCGGSPDLEAPPPSAPPTGSESPPPSTPTTPSDKWVNLTLKISGVGQGEIEGLETPCQKTNERVSCTIQIKQGSKIELKPIPAKGYTFQGWYLGDCSGAEKCTLTLDKNTEVNAAFGMIAFASNKDAVVPTTKNIFISTTNGNIRRLTDLPAGYIDVDSIQWSPDGERLIYRKTITSVDGLKKFYSIQAIQLSPSGSKIKEAEVMKSLENAPYSAPQFSPDGKRLAYHWFYDGFDTIRLIEMNESLNAFNIKDPFGITIKNCHARLPRWSPDGEKIYFFSNCALVDGKIAPEEDRLNLWAANVSTETSSYERPTENHQKGMGLELITSIDSLTDLEISPDGKKVSFSNFNAPAKRVWEVNLENKEIVNLTPTYNADVANIRPQWSLDGETILFLSNREVSFPYDPNAKNEDPANPTKTFLNIWKIDAVNGGLSHPVTLYNSKNQTTIEVLRPVFTREGSGVFYFAYENGVPLFSIVNSDGMTTPILKFESSSVAVSF